MSKNTLYYIAVEDSKFAKFSLLSKIYQRQHDVPERLIIPNFGHCTENISPISDYEFTTNNSDRTLVKSYIKDTKHFLSKLKSLGKLVQGVILWTIDVVGL